MTTSGAGYGLPMEKGPFWGGGGAKKGHFRGILGARGNLGMYFSV